MNAGETYTSAGGKIMHVRSVLDGGMIEVIEDGAPEEAAFIVEADKVVAPKPRHTTKEYTMDEVK